MRNLDVEECQMVDGGSQWGENVLKYAGVGGAIGSFFSPAGAAAGIVAGGVVGTIVTLAD
jgi:Bacteriocin class II with double-glycine leader peptide